MKNKIQPMCYIPNDVPNDVLSQTTSQNTDLLLREKWCSPEKNVLWRIDVLWRFTQHHVCRVLVLPCPCASNPHEPLRFISNTLGYVHVQFAIRIAHLQLPSSFYHHCHQLVFFLPIQADP